MCGIVGIFKHSGNESPVQISMLEQMSGEIIHRGPDSCGFYLNSSRTCGIGFRRLSIIDLTGGDQPIWNEEKSVVLFCNGEIYNYQQLRSELIKKGHLFSTNSDAEVLVHLYEEYGDSFLNEINGMYAFVIYDLENNRLLLARDRFGEKPLYYYHDSNQIVFCSELVSLKRMTGLDLSLSKEALNLYSRFGYIPAPYSIYKNVKKIKAAHYLSVDKNGIEEKSYWQLQFNPLSPDKLSYREAIQKTESLLLSAIERQLVSDVPLGLYLSGGIDSSILLKMMKHLVNEPIKTYSVGFSDASYDESLFAKQLATYYNTDHHEHCVTPQNMLDRYMDALHYFDEPHGNPTALPLFLLSEFAGKDVKVVITGNGADELFAGYGRHYAPAYGNYLRKCPQLSRFFARHLPDSLDRSNYIRRLKRLMQNETCPFPLSHFSWLSYLPLGENNLILRSDLQIDLQTLLLDWIPKADYDDYLSVLLGIDSLFYLEGQVLSLGDRMSMANSVEARSPFLDRDLAEFASSLPNEYKRKRSTGKRVLRTILENDLPKRITRRGKYGFSVPVGRWLKEDLNSYVKERLSASVLYDYFDRKKILDIYNEHQSGKVDHGFLLWSLISFDHWLAHN